MTINTVKRRRDLLLALPFATIAFMGTPAAAETAAGTLQCETDSGLFHFGSTQHVTCVFHATGGRNEAYSGQIGDLHLGLRTAGSGVMVWTVFAPQSTIPYGELAGSYADRGARGRPALADGSDATLTLRPASTGRTFNVATGVGTLDLVPLMSAPQEASDHHRRIPAVGLASTSQGAHYGCGSYVHVASGDTMSRIAHRCGVSLEALMRANPEIRDVRALRIGQTLAIPSHINHAGTSPCGTHVTLHQGESLQEAAWRCGVTQHALAMANPPLRSLGGLHEGLVLALPAERTAGGPMAVVAAKPAPATTAALQADFADGLSGGPDVWHVVGVEPGHRLNLRAGPSTANPIVDHVEPGAALANRGCRMVSGERWCQVAELDGSGIRGWAAGRFLAEGAVPSSPHTTPVAAVPQPSTVAAPGAPSASRGEARDRTERVQFNAGESETTIRDSLTGPAGVDYIVNAAEGQTLSVDLSAAGTAYFNVLHPMSEQAIFVGSREVDPAFEQMLEQTGDYRIRVYLMGGDRDEGQTVDYRLRIAVTGERTTPAPVATEPSPPASAMSTDAMVAGTNFHATGEIVCVDENGEASCPFGVVRHGNGTADVTITRPDGRPRTIFFEGGKAVAADIAEADGDVEFAVERQGDMSIVTIGDQRYEVFDAIVFGG